MAQNQQEEVAQVFKLLFSLLILSFGLQAEWIDRKAEGWAWYEDVDKTVVAEEKENPLDNAKENPSKSPSEQLAEITKVLDDKKATAVMHPTKANVLEYQKEQRKWVNNSEIFSAVWRQNMLDNPQFDETVKNPSSHYAKSVHRNQLVDERNKLCRELGEENALFFFFKGDDVMCQTFAPIVKMFEEKHGWAVVPITIDGYSVKEFPEAIEDPTLVDAFSLDVYPGLFAVNPDTEEAVPIVFGAVSLDIIERNIMLQFKGAEDE